MKTSLSPRLLLAFGLALLPAALSAQTIFVANVAGNSAGQGYISTYNLNGTLANSSLITGLYSPYDLTVQGSSLYLLNKGAGEVRRYNLDGTGGTTLVSGLTNASALTVTGSNLFVATVNSGVGVVYQYTTGGGLLNSFTTDMQNLTSMAVSGTTVYLTGNLPSQQGSLRMFDASVLFNGTTTSLVTSINGVGGLALSGANLYYFFQAGGLYNVSVYDTGALGVTNLVTGINAATDIAVFGGSLYVSSLGGDTWGNYNRVGQFSATDGASITVPLIGGLDNPYSVAIGGSAVPEPSAYAALAAAAILGFVMWRRREVGRAAP